MTKDAGKFRRIFLIGVAIFTVAAGCNKGETAPAINCPPGTRLMGQAPPNGDEQWCEKLVNGQPLKDGIFVLYRETGTKMIEGHYKDGKQDGVWTMYFESGQKKSVDHYRDGVQEGEHLGWYENGQLAAKGQFKNGQPDGVWKRWGPDGVRNWEEVYKDGKKIS